MGSRGQLDERYSKIISAEVPEAFSIQEWTLRLDPARFAMVFGPGTNRDEIAACLQDAASFLAETRYALAEAHAHWIWHTEMTERSDPIAASFWSQFYLDDAILRIYSTAEAVAAFADLYLQTRSLKRPLTKKERRELRGESRFIGLSNLLQAVGSTGDLQTQITTVGTDPNWRFMTDYRNKWTHEQRPRLKGLGLSYQRRNRWEQDKEDIGGNTWTLGIGGGDPPDLTVDEFFEKTDSAYVLLRGVVEECCREMEHELSVRERRFPERLEPVIDAHSEPPRVLGKRIIPQQIDSSIRD